MRKMQDIICTQCGHIEIDKYVDLDLLDTCECGGEFDRVLLENGKANSVIGDDIPGGLEIKNLLVGPNGEPTKWYTKSAIRAAAKEKGYHWGAVDHVPSRGSDKAKHTSRWV